MFTHTGAGEKRHKSGAGKLDHSTQEMRGKKVEPVQTDFTDDVISESNATNEQAYRERKRERGNWGS